MPNWLPHTALKLHHILTGRNVLACLNELNRTQYFDRGALLHLQHERLRQVVAYACRYVPYYKYTFEQAGFHPDDLRNGPEAMRRLPILTKNVISRNMDDLLTTEPGRPSKLNEVRTSGSTGHPLTFMQDGDHRDHGTADIQRHLGWGGEDGAIPRLYLGEPF
jgi:phenylacetate-CoA ligase